MTIELTLMLVLLILIVIMFSYFYGKYTQRKDIILLSKSKNLGIKNKKNDIDKKAEESYKDKSDDHINNTFSQL